jgi:thioredoxin 1
MMAQVIDNEIIPSMSDLKVVKVNVDEAPELAAKFNVMSIPALFCFKDGVKTAEFVGVTSVAQIRAAL